MIRWMGTKPIDISYIRKTEERLGIKFPADYVQYALKYNDGSPSPDAFDIEGRNPGVFVRLLSHDPNSSSYIVSIYHAIRDRLLDGVYPFADGAFGNFICFDYRQDQKNPSIVFWDHEKLTHKAIFPVCRSFTELLSKLYEFEDDDIDIDAIDIW